MPSSVSKGRRVNHLEIKLLSAASTRIVSNITSSMTQMMNGMLVQTGWRNGLETLKARHAVMYWKLLIIKMTVSSYDGFGSWKFGVTGLITA